jgi:hypothetical protein
MIDWPELSKLVLSFIGGVIVTYVGHILSIRREREKSKREILVLCDYKLGKTTWLLASDVDRYVDIVGLTIINISQRPITIVDAGLHMENGNYFLIKDKALDKWELPKKLNDGDMINIPILVSDVSKVLREEKSKLDYGWACDATETIYRAIPTDKLMKKLEMSLGE